jgi:TRAP-type transport system periplasmic protein
MLALNFKRLSAMATAVGFSLVLGASVQTAAAADVTLNYSPWLPDGYPLNAAVLKPWMAEIETATEGRVKFNWLPKAVGKATAQF